MARIHESANREMIKNAERFGGQLSSLKDSALGLGKALAQAGLIGEKDMTKLASGLLKVEAGFGGLRHGLDTIQRLTQAWGAFQKLTGGGPGTFGKMVASATGSARLGNLAWSAASGGGLQAGLASGASALGAAAGPGIIAGGALAAGGLASHLYQMHQGTAAANTWWGKHVVSNVIPGAAEQGMEANRQQRALGVLDSFSDFGMTGTSSRDTWAGVEKQNKAFKKSDAAWAKSRLSRDQMEGNARDENAQARSFEADSTWAAQGSTAATFYGRSNAATDAQKKDAWRFSALGGAPDRGQEKAFKGLFEQGNDLAGQAEQIGWNRKQNDFFTDKAEARLKQSGGGPEEDVKNARDVVRLKREGLELSQKEGEIAVKRKENEAAIVDLKAQGLRAAANQKGAEYKSEAAGVSGGLAGLGMDNSGKVNELNEIQKKIDAGTELNPQELAAASSSGLPHLQRAAATQAEDRGRRVAPELAAAADKEAGGIGREANRLGGEATAQETISDKLKEEMDTTREAVAQEMQAFFEDLVQLFKQINADSEKVRSRAMNDAKADAYHKQANEKAAA